MENIDFGPLDKGPDVVVGVFPDGATAQRVCDELVREGIPAGRIRLGADEDEVASLRGEMREELDQSIVGGAIAGPYTKEMTKGGFMLGVIGAVIGVIIAFPFSFIPVASAPWWLRFVVLVIIGAMAGALIGVMIGVPLAAKGPGDRLAAQRGVTVAVTGSLEVAERVMARNQPLRVDLVDPHGNPMEVVDEARETSTTVELRRHLDEDDYRRDDEPPAR